MSSSPSLALWVLPGELAVCRLPADAPCPAVPDRVELYSVTRTRGELSVVCPAADAPPGAAIEREWRALAITGPLDFGLVGVLSEISRQLAAAAIPIFVLSTYHTDYILVRDASLAAAVDELRAAGHTVAIR